LLHKKPQEAPIIVTNSFATPPKSKKPVPTPLTSNAKQSSSTTTTNSAHQPQSQRQSNKPTQSAISKTTPTPTLSLATSKPSTPSLTTQQPSQRSLSTQQPSQSQPHRSKSQTNQQQPPQSTTTSTMSAKNSANLVSTSAQKLSKQSTTSINNNNSYQSKKAQKLSYSNAVTNQKFVNSNNVNVGNKQNLNDLDDFETTPSKVNNKLSAPVSTKPLSSAVIAASPSASTQKQVASTQQRKQQQLPSTEQQSLADLDDFEQPSTIKSSKLSNISANSRVITHRQRIVVPHDKFTRVMGRNNCNIKVIQDLTEAILELEDKKIPPNQDRSILISGESTEITKYAFELLQALINDSDVDLVNLLPSTQNASSSSSSAVVVTSAAQVLQDPPKKNVNSKWTISSKNFQFFKNTNILKFGTY
jgi:hypothetical protein